MCLLVLASCGRTNGKLPDLTDNFLFDSDLPMGGSAAFKMLKQAYPNKFYQQKKEGFSSLNYNLEDSRSLYYMTGRNFFVNELEVEDLLSFVQRGNSVFIAARYIDTSLLNKIGLAGNNIFFEQMPGGLDETRTGLSANEFEGDSSFEYFYQPFANSFSALPPKSIRILGANEDKVPNFLVYYFGKGRLYLHCDPRALTNYFLLHNENYNYFQQILQLLPARPDHIFIDDHYCRQTYKPRESDGSLLGFIFNNPPLAWGFLILVAAFLLYILMNGKRRQRIIPIKKPVYNATVSFTEAMAGLYLKDKDNRNIAEKMITYFLEETRTKHFINTTKLNEDFTQALSRKTGNSLNATKDLVYIMKMVQDGAEVTDDLLMDLNNKLQNFKTA